MKPISTCPAGEIPMGTATALNELSKLLLAGTRRKRLCSMLTKNSSCHHGRRRVVVKVMLKRKPLRQGRTNGLVTAARGDCRHDLSSLHNRSDHLHLYHPPLFVHAQSAFWFSAPSLH